MALVASWRPAAVNLVHADVAPRRRADELGPPGRDEVELICRGLRSATRPTGQDDAFQVMVLEAVTHSMTGFDIDMAALEPIDAAEFGARRRRQRAVPHPARPVDGTRQPGPDPARLEVADRVIDFAGALHVDNACIHKARAVADGSHHLVAADFDRNDTSSGCPDAMRDGPTPPPPGRSRRSTRTSPQRWRNLGRLPAPAIGRRVHDFYEARGFRFPGEPGSAPPLLAQHDWVHVLGDFGTTVECELEVFGFIARASHDPQAFAPLAMAILLFQTGSLESAAGIFQADGGHLGATGMPARLADAMRCGALSNDGVDFLAVDWFALSEHSVEDLRPPLGITEKNETCAPRAPRPWEPGGLSPFQLAAGRRLADEQGRTYATHGAAVS